MDQKEKIFLSILEAHKGIIYKVANTYCYDSADQDDLIQEIIVQIWLSIERFNDKFMWSTWIYRVALNTSISFYRKNRSRKENTVRLSPVMDVPVSGDEEDTDTEYLLLRQFIRALKEIDRGLMLLHLEGLSSKEIADIMNTSQSNVTTKISRIKKKIRTQFEKHKSKSNGEY